MTQSQTPELQGYCPVAYHAVGQALKGSPNFQAVHEGKLYYFVNAEAKQEFEQTPAKYVPAYGGQCAFGMSIEKEFESCPTSFKIIDGQTHLFLKNEETDALALWEKDDQSKCRANADKHWATRQTT